LLDVLFRGDPALWKEHPMNNRYTIPNAVAALALAGLAWLGATAAAQAQTYPTKPVRYIVPFPAGASPDIVGRLMADRLSRVWGQQVVVDNRSGAGGTVGAAIAARAAADGYTFFQCNIASNAIAAALYAKLPYDPPRDFAPITRIGTTANLIIVHPSFPANTVAEFVAHARANPGKLSYGSSAAGTSPHLGMELFSTLAKINVVHISYKGAPQAISDLIGGQVPIAVSNIPALLPPIQAGRARAIAVTSLKRAPQVPTTPTMDESGFKGFEVTSWYGLCAPTGTPAAILDKVHTDLTKILQSADVQQRMTELVIEPAPTSRAAFTDYMATETKRWAQVARDAKLAPQ
jgi:tripartite-type tricarboxylate transporter receptor subunit TctC